MPGALLIGIDDYKNFDSLSGCVADAKAMRDMLETNYDGSPNYECRLLTSGITKGTLRTQWIELLATKGHGEDALLYFAGHGTPMETGGFLVTEDGDNQDPGLPMDELLVLANKTQARTVLLILDCCYSGYLGNPAGLNQAQLREGVTILAASRPTEAARESGSGGLFTKLVLGALSGGAADVRGRVSAAAIYAYAEQALGFWDQRPLYKSHANRLAPVRLCKPAVEDALLRELAIIFSRPEATVRMDPSYEFTHPTKDPKNVELFQKFKILRNAGLLTTEEEKDLYFVALESQTVRLTPLGQFYWQLAYDKRIR